MSEVKDYNLKFRNIEIRINANFEEFDKVLENIKNLDDSQYLFKGVSGVELGEKDNYENVEHIHVLLIANGPIKVQTHINRIGWKKYKNYNDDRVGYHIMSIDKAFVLDRINYLYKKKTKVSVRRLYEYTDPEFWAYIDTIKVVKTKKNKINKSPMEVQKERLDIAKNIYYDDILTTEDETVLEHKGFFNKTDGMKFYASVRNKEIELIIEKIGNRYDCIPEDCTSNSRFDKGVIEPFHNIMILGATGDGKTQTMEWCIKDMFKERYYPVKASRFMDRYDPRMFDKLFCDELDALKLKEMGGPALFKENTCGKAFSYEEKHVKMLLSDYKPWWVTSNARCLVDLKDKNDKNDDGSLAPALERRFHILTLREFQLNFGIKFIRRGVYEIVEPVRLFHRNGRYHKLCNVERVMMDMEDK